jgi:hypothetical protein
MEYGGEIGNPADMVPRFQDQPGAWPSSRKSRKPPFPHVHHFHPPTGIGPWSAGLGQTGMIDNGFVHIPEDAAWLGAYLHEMTVFPKGKHDDQVDSAGHFPDWFKRPFPNQGTTSGRVNARKRSSSTNRNHQNGMGDRLDGIAEQRQAEPLRLSHSGLMPRARPRRHGG